MKTIYNTYVIMDSQEQCDRMKKTCIDNKIPIYHDFSFYMTDKKTPYVYFYCYEGEFCNYLEPMVGYIKITENEFEYLINNLLKNPTWVLDN